MTQDTWHKTRSTTHNTQHTRHLGQHTQKKTKNRKHKTRDTRQPHNTTHNTLTLLTFDYFPWRISCHMFPDDTYTLICVLCTCKSDNICFSQCHMSLEMAYIIFLFLSYVFHISICMFFTNMSHDKTCYKVFPSVYVYGMLTTTHFRITHFFLNDM